MWISDSVKLVTSIVLQGLGGSSENRQDDDFHEFFLQINEVKVITNYIKFH